MTISTQGAVPGIPPSLISAAIKETSTGMTMGHIIAWLVFGLIGMAAFGYGRKQVNSKMMITGAVLMIYPYVLTHVVALWAVGTGLTAFLFFPRD